MNSDDNANAVMRMLKKRWFRLFGMDFMSSRKVIPMNIAQRGAYFQLLVLAWDDPHCSLPTNEDELKTMAMWDEKFGSFTPVRSCFTTHPEDRKRLHNARLYEEWLYAQGKSLKAKESAKKGWEERTKQKPVMPIKDRASKGFQKIGDELHAVADKYFPPV